MVMSFNNEFDRKRQEAMRNIARPAAPAAYREVPSERAADTDQAIEAARKQLDVAKFMLQRDRTSHVYQQMHEVAKQRLANLEQQKKGCVIVDITECEEPSGGRKRVQWAPDQTRSPTVETRAVKRPTVAPATNLQEFIRLNGMEARAKRATPADEEEDDPDFLKALAASLETSELETRRSLAADAALTRRSELAQAGRTKRVSDQEEGAKTKRVSDQEGAKTKRVSDQEGAKTKQSERELAMMAARERHIDDDRAKMVKFFETGKDPLDPFPLLNSQFFRKACDGVASDEDGVPMAYPFIPDRSRSYPYLKFLLGEPASGHKEPDFIISRVDMDLFLDQSRHNDWAFIFPTLHPSNISPEAKLLTQEEVRMIHMVPDALDAMERLVSLACDYFGMDQSGMMDTATTAGLLYTDKHGNCSHECRRVTRFLAFCRLNGFYHVASRLRNGLFRLCEDGELEIPAATLKIWFNVSNTTAPLI